ncbi:MAG: trypsin-like peptidase domain-containing protein [Phocaeicola plebeius]|uniref:S1C family serine protease n=1 Tax=Phocaeicola plebeius TaxID=310297 RepID=UPI00241C9DAB|nr:serine protease [Phocaeicola plebeius]MBS5541179.1 trypsin-like peptidase domain-containing protein [Phocaeicola plebeius]
MKTNKLLLLVSSLFIIGCAHKSGHNKQGFSQEERSIISQQSTMRRSGTKVTDNNQDRVKMDGAEIFSKYNTAVFMVFTSDGYNMYQGSGFFINNSGLAVSNYHVFQNTSIGEEGIKLAGSNDIYKVSEILQRSEKEDFILFRVNITNTNYIPVARYKPNVGEKVFAIGSPRGLENTFSSGEISQWRDRNLMQISALIDHGSSGGALINEYGEAIGITSGSFYDGSQANLNYAWSIDVIKPYINFK